jgi:membrane protease YdiL (CAAX protease family)
MYSNAISTGISNFILFAVVLLIRKRVHKEGLRDFLIQVDKRGLRLFIEGIIVGITGFIIYTLIVYLFGEGTYNYQTNTFKKSLLLFLTYGMGFLAVALFEESLIRGYILQKLLKRLSMVQSIIISSAIFGGLHFFAYSSSYYFWIGIINASILGVLLSVIVIKTKSLMMAVGFHLAWNLTQRILFLNNIFNYNVSINFKIREGLLSGTYFVPESGFAVSIVLLVISIYIFIRFRQEKKNVKCVA